MSNDDFRTTRRSVLKLAGTAALGAAGFSSAASAAGVEWDEDDVVTDANGKSEWILRIDRKVSDDTEVSVQTAKATAEESQRNVAKALSTKRAYRVDKQFWLSNAMLVKADKDAATAEKELSALSDVRTVHPNFRFEGPEPVEKRELVPQKDHEYTYGLEQINAPEVWERFDTKGEGTSVAVLDTGIDASHPAIDLPEDNWAFFDAEGKEVDSDPFDPNDHGTHTSGTVSGKAPEDDDVPQFGVAPETELYHAKVLDNGGTWAQIVAGMQWAVENGVDVINMSLGGSGIRPSWIEPVQNVVRAGTVLVASSGNSGPNTSGSPGDVYEAFAIGASDSDRKVASFSSGRRIKTEDWNAWWLTQDWPLNYYVPDVSAPGVDVLSSVPGGEYAMFNGTSMAAPHVAGATALLISALKQDQDLGVEDVKAAFEETAIHGEGPDATPGPRYGEGIIDALSAITAQSDDNVVEGTVTYDGEPLEGAVVRTDYGTRAETDENGEFSLYLGDGEWTLSVDEFGFSSDDVTVDVSGGETVEQDLVLSDEVDVQLAAGQPDVVGQGESFEIMASVANLESVTVSLGSGSDLGEDDLTVLLGGNELTFGEAYDLPQPLSGKATMVVQVSDNAPLGEFSLDHTFAGPAEPVEASTGPTNVMADPADASLEFVDWDKSKAIEMGQTHEAYAVVENTGDRTAVQPVQWWVGDPQGINVFTAAVVELEGGESTTIPFPITFPTAFAQPGGQIDHGWKTPETTVRTTATFKGPLYVFDSVDAPGQVDYGDTMEVTATVRNVGNLAAERSVEMSFAGVPVNSKGVEAEPGTTDTVTFEFDSGRVVRDKYQFTLAEPNWAEYVQSAKYVDTVWIGEPQLPELDVTGNGKAATDTTGDGLLNDVNGDGTFDMADLQAFYKHYDEEIVQKNAEFFNFSGDAADRVNRRDVQALYKMLSQQ